MAKLYRISGKSYSIQDPTGAALSSEGRWHIPGQRVLCLSASLATCVLELRANGVSYRSILDRFHFGTATFPDNLVSETVPNRFYAKGWQLRKSISQEFGALWYAERRSPLLFVRSAVLPTEMNCLLNTAHPEFHQVVFSRSRPVPLDERLTAPAH